MSGINLLLKCVSDELKAGRTMKEIIKNFIKSINKELDYKVDFDFLYDEFDEINKLRIDTYSYSNVKELDNAFENTLKEYDIDISNFILVDALKQLAKADKLILVDNLAYCVKIGLLLDRLNDSKNSLTEHKRLSSLSILLGGLATHKNSDISECINPRISSLDEALYLNNKDISTVLAREILTEYKFNSYDINLALYSLEHIGKKNINFSLIKESNIDTIFQLRKFLNSSTPLKEVDFFRSAQIFLLTLYKKNNFTDVLMNLKTHISQTKIVKSINIIMEHYLDMPKSSVYNGCFTKNVQLKTYFFDTPIYEYRTKENIKLHPVFENEQELKTISRLIQ